MSSDGTGLCERAHCQSFFFFFSFFLIYYSILLKTARVHTLANGPHTTENQKQPRKEIANLAVKKKKIIIINK